MRFIASLAWVAAVDTKWRASEIKKQKKLAIEIWHFWLIFCRFQAEFRTIHLAFLAPIFAILEKKLWK